MAGETPQIYKMALSRRVERVNELIKREVSQIILKQLEFPPDSLVTLTRVETSSDLKNSAIFFSVLPEDKSFYVSKTLNQRVYDIQQTINKKLRIRPVPKIRFKLEKSTSEADKIEKLLEEIKSNN